jgi:hypothetical protein
VYLLQAMDFARAAGEGRERRMVGLTEAPRR